MIIIEVNLNTQAKKHINLTKNDQFQEKFALKVAERTKSIAVIEAVNVNPHIF